MTITVNLRYTGKNGSARRFAEEMTDSGTVAAIRAEAGNYDPGINGLRTAFENAAPYYKNLNNGQEFKVVRNYTRAQIIPYIIDIQHALDYYYQIEHYEQ